MDNFALPIDCLKAVLAVMPKDEIRYYLNGLHINAHGHWLEATDGIVALRIPIPCELPADMDNIIVSREAVEQIVAAAKADGSHTVVMRREGSNLYRATVGAHDVIFGGLNAQFPDLDRVFTPGQPTPPADMLPYSFNATYLNKWFKAQRVLFKSAYLHDGDEPPAQVGIGYLLKRQDVQCVIAACKQGEKK